MSLPGWMVFNNKSAARLRTLRTRKTTRSYTVYKGRVGKVGSRSPRRANYLAGIMAQRQAIRSGTNIVTSPSMNVSFRAGARMAGLSNINADQTARNRSLTYAAFSGYFGARSDKLVLGQSKRVSASRYADPHRRGHVPAYKPTMPYRAAGAVMRGFRLGWTEALHPRGFGGKFRRK